MPERQPPACPAERRRALPVSGLLALVPLALLTMMAGTGGVFAQATDRFSPNFASVTTDRFSLAFGQIAPDPLATTPAAAPGLPGPDDSPVDILFPTDIADDTLDIASIIPPGAVPLPPQENVNLLRQARNLNATGITLGQADIDLIAAIGAYHASIRSMAGRFQQIDASGTRQDGVFFLVRPDKIRFKYAPPAREEIISTGRGFYVIDRKARTSFAYPQERVPLRQFLTDKVDLLSANIVDLVKTEEMVAITIADDTPIGPVKVTLIFDLGTYELAQWSLTEPGGDEVTFSVYDTRNDIDIPRGYFYIDPTYSSPSRRR
jgi:outer membrane lipoprotein-sorting protein